MMRFIDHHISKLDSNFGFFKTLNYEMLLMPEISSGSTDQYITCVRLTGVSVHSFEFAMANGLCSYTSDDLDITIHKSVGGMNVLKNYKHSVVIDGLYFEWNFSTHRPQEILFELTFTKRCIDFARLYRDRCSL